MTTVDGRHTIDREAERLAYKPPEIRHDKQGDMDDEKRVTMAMHHFVKNFNTQTASYLDGCLHCGMCADACHFHVRTDDPRYTPIWKIELFKRTYKRQVGPFAFFYRLLGLKRTVTVKDLEEWQHLLYDSCTVCGRCSLVCPMGIDIAGLVSMARHGMFKAGLIPHELHEVAKTAAETGSPLGISGEKFAERADWMGDEHDVEIPMDEEQADVLAVMSSIPSRRGAAAPDQRDTKPQTVRACRPSCSCLLSVYNAYKLSVLRTFLFKLHVPVFLGEQRVIATESNVGASMKTGAALANNDVACHDFLAAVDFDA